MQLESEREKIIKIRKWTDAAHGQVHFQLVTREPFILNEWLLSNIIDEYQYRKVSKARIIHIFSNLSMIDQFDMNMKMCMI